MAIEENGEKLPEHSCGKQVNHGRHPKAIATKFEKNPNMSLQKYYVI
tara:strand:+ start:407 stop:547 length:141 start_codon:yes stop_codon:yes gene_type:complete